MTRGHLGTTIIVGVLAVLSIGIVRADIDPAPTAPASVPAPEVPQQASYVLMGGCATSKCHAEEATWAKDLDGDGKGKRSHFNAANQLEPSQYENVTEYVKAMNLTDAYTPTCMDCHATQRSPEDFEGVTCERCHGPGSRYKDIHADEEKPASAYVSLGMKDYSTGNRWAGLCYSCHVLGPKYQALVNAGHPNGSDFDLTKKFQIVQGVGSKRTHWKKPGRVHTAAQVRAFAGAPPTMVTRRAVDPPRPGPEALTTPVTPPPVAPPPAPPTSPVAPASIVLPPPVSERVAPPVITTPASPRGGTPSPLAPPVHEPVPPAAVAESGPRTVSAVLATVQGRVISVLASLLGQEVSVPQRVVPPRQPPNFTGPDAELLRLQYDVITLALELLGTAPPRGGR